MDLITAERDLANAGLNPHRPTWGTTERGECRETGVG